MSRLWGWPAPDDAAEAQIRQLELLGLVNGAVFLAGLASLVLSFPLSPTPFRLAALSLLAACAGFGVWLLRSFWSVLDRELRRRKQAEQEARAADRAKGQFLAHVSHEIRTPMNGVLGMTELLLSSEVTVTQRERLEVIRSSSEALLALVNDLLDVSRIDAGRMLLRPRDYSFRELVQDVFRLLAPQAAEREVELRLALAPALPDSLHGDPARLRQVLVNLIGNGIRFTRNGSVTVAAEPLERETPAFRCEVSDTGVGIRPEVQAQLFQPFTRIESSSSHGSKGAGLGLFISRNLIELMGGEIGFHSTRGVGTTFWFQIPLVPARGDAPMAPVTAPEARHERPVLVVDDRSGNRLVALVLLRKLGYAAEAVQSGEEALAFLEKTPCAAVLLDVEMPGLDGLETCRRLRRQEGEGRRTPVFALSAHTSDEERERCLAAGMDGFLSKPFQASQLAALLGVSPPAESLDDRLAALQSLERKTGEPLLAQVVGEFLRQGESDLAAMWRALPQGDAKALGEAAHALSGSAAVLGAAELARSAGEIAGLARQGDLRACAPKLPGLEREFRAVAHRLQLNKR